MRHGHQVVLHTYDPPQDVPKGVKLFDASMLMDRREVVAHKDTGSLAYASDIYRYRILSADLGVYVDCDMYCLAPFPNRPYLLGWQYEMHRDKHIGTGVLAAPAESELVKVLRRAGDDPFFIPEWHKKRDIRIHRLRRALGFPKRTCEMRWGDIGPQLVEHRVRALDLVAEVQEIDVFYPLHYKHLSLLHKPGLKLADLVTRHSLAIHLYNNKLGRPRPVPNTPLAEILSKENECGERN